LRDLAARLPKGSQLGLILSVADLAARGEAPPEAQAEALRAMVAAVEKLPPFHRRMLAGSVLRHTAGVIGPWPAGPMRTRTADLVNSRMIPLLRNSGEEPGVLLGGAAPAEFPTEEAK